MAERLKLVVDTNVVVSAALQPLGNPARALFLALDRHRVFVSREIFDEYADVLFRKKLKLDPKESNSGFCERSLRIRKAAVSHLRLQRSGR